MRKTKTTATTKRTKDGEEGTEGTEGRRGAAPRDDCGKCIKACPNFAIAINATRGQTLEERAARAEADSGLA